MDTQTFTIQNLDGNLAATVTAGVGTEITNDANSVAKRVKLLDNSYLIDGSFNHVYSTTDGNTYTHAFKYGVDVDTTYEDRTALATAAASTSGNPATADGGQWKYSTRGSNSYYVAVSWSITFTYTFTSNETNNIGVYLNLQKDKSFFTSTNETGDITDGNSAKGFRIAFLEGGASGSLNKVWGALASTSAEDGLNSQKDSSYKYVSTTSASAAYTNVDGATTTSQADFLSSASMVETYTAVSDLASDCLLKKERVATIAHPDSGSSASTTVKCVAWYEGEDPNVINEAVLRSCSATMSFYSRLDVAAS